MNTKDNNSRLKNLYSLDDSSTLAIKVVQKDQLDVAKDLTIRYTRNIYGITDNNFTTNQLKNHIKKTIMDQNRNFSLTFILLCKAIHIKVELSTTEGSTIR